MNYFSPLTTEEINQSKDKFDLKVEEVDKAIRDGLTQPVYSV